MRKQETLERQDRTNAQAAKLPSIAYTICEDKKGVFVNRDWIPIQKYKQAKPFCAPCDFPLNAMGFIYAYRDQGNVTKIFYPLSKDELK